MKIEIEIRSKMPNGNKVDKSLQELIIFTSIMRSLNEHFSVVIDVVRKED